MTKYKLEYIWLDGYTPVPNLRGKTQIKELRRLPDARSASALGLRRLLDHAGRRPISDCVLKPVAIYPDGARKNGALVMCEVMMPDGVTPHSTNKRATILDDPGAWFGFEQEYFFYKDGRPLGFPDAGYPAPQGPYYTGVGYKNVGSVAREIVEEASRPLPRSPASTTKASTPKWRRASGNSRSSARAPRRPPTKCGWPAT